MGGSEDDILRVEEGHGGVIDIGGVLLRRGDCIVSDRQASAA